MNRKRMENMNKQDKINAIKNLLNAPSTVEKYYELLENMGDLKTNYHTYATTEPINCDKELERIPSADYELCTALLTMILREDHFSNGSFKIRQEKGQVNAILKRMLETLIE